MARRSGVLTGLGNSAPEIMNGQSTGNSKLDGVINECAKDCYETFFKGTKMDYETIDAGADEYGIVFGIEPAYKDWELKIIVFMQNKSRCRYETGIARGWYGSQIQSSDRYYGDYKYSTKFTKFVDKWHSRLFPTPNPQKRSSNG